MWSAQARSEREARALKEPARRQDPNKLNAERASCWSERGDMPLQVVSLASPAAWSARLAYKPQKPRMLPCHMACCLCAPQSGDWQRRHILITRSASRGLHPVVLRGQAMSGHCLAREARYSGRVMLRPLDLVESIISHAGFRVRLGDGQRTIAATPAAAESFCAGVGVADLGQVQAGVAPADIAAHEQRPIYLAKGAEAKGNTEATDHGARLEPGNG